MNRRAKLRAVAFTGILSLLGLLALGLDFGEPRAAWSRPPADVLDEPFPLPPELIGVELMRQTDSEMLAKSSGCVTCHREVGDPHCKDTLHIGCVDCHGGNACATDKFAAHPKARFPEAWRSSANPVRSYALLNHESPEYIRFVNPGDLRVAHMSCGLAGCHPKEVETNRKQIMATGAMLWGSALYNNGSVPFKQARFGECYGTFGAPLRLQTVPPPTDHEVACKGVAPFLDPLPRFEASQPGNVLRFFERGGRFRAETGIPETKEEPGRPRARLGTRGLGAENRTDPVLVSLNKSRLFDPTLNFLGTNDHPGDYRSSGCTSCHVIYANDRSPVHSGPYAEHGNRGYTKNPDPCIPKGESGHPIEHKFTSAIPTSQCMVCHVHPGTNVMNSYLGYMWWDEETEGQFMYPAKQRKLTSEDLMRAAMLNPDEAAARGNWISPAFLNDITELNPQMSKTQFADFHSHGWVFRAVFKKDREGRLLDVNNEVVPNVTPQHLMQAVKVPELVKHAHAKPPAEVKGELARVEKCRSGVPVHQLDIHMEKGMHCVDCHFSQDVHGNGRLHTEVRAASEIQCIDCHGTIETPATLRTSGPAAYTSSADGYRDLRLLKTPHNKPRFERDGQGRIFQNSMVEKGLRWEVKQVIDTIDPNKIETYNAKSHLAKTVRFEKGEMVWGDIPPGGEEACAHRNSNMSCIACHSSWNPSCYGCHLPQRANAKAPHLHWDGDVTRNYVPYNFQTLRDDIYMLARDGDVTKNKIGPARSSCAVHVGSYNQNRESIYPQQQTISAEGFGGTAFSTNVPHTVRGKNDTKRCTDCHVSKENDNNAWMAQLLMHGTGYMNFIGKYCWVATGEHGLAAVTVTERDEPQAVIGSTMHRLAFPDDFAKFVKHDRRLDKAFEHPGRDILETARYPRRQTDVLQVQARGEYLYAACGEGGVRVFDIAMIDNKGFSERITTAPVSPVGQRFHVATKDARYVAAATTVAVDPTRTRLPENKEGPIHPLFGYLYVADKQEGLILVGAATTIDGNPLNNYLTREVTFNPDGLLCGANYVTIIGNYAYVCCDAGLAVVGLDDPKHPKLVSLVKEPYLNKPHAIAGQFRYAYVCDEDGIKVLDISDLTCPRVVSMIRMPHCHNIYLARTYAYVAAGPRGLVILDIKVADRPKIDQVFDAGGCINDAHDVKLGVTYVSEFAYVADGKNGLRVVQLTSPDTPGNDGFSPRPTPKLVATFKVPHGGHALAVSRGLDRDRAVDECGNQIGVFGRVGARPLNGDEQRKMFWRDGQPWTVTDNPRDSQYRMRTFVRPAGK